MSTSKVAIIGGKLQGLEVVYLAKKAGIKSLVIDRNEQVISRQLCDEFFCCDVREKSPELVRMLKSADFVLPAIENDEVLEAITELCELHGLKLAFDLKSYQISSSKLRSDQLFHENQIPSPKYYPGCEGPYIAKPSVASGSDGVTYIETEEELKAFLASKPKEENWVVQEFLSGPSYSIEVIGVPGNYRTYEITEIHMDEVYDCKRVTAPCDIPKKTAEDFSKLGIRLAELVNLHGIMDVEVIDDRGEFKVLEIDARVPSQTPTAVYYATGVNMVEELKDLFVDGKFKNLDQRNRAQVKHASFEHFKITENLLKTNGEHIISSGRPLRLRDNFCGADEVLTDYTPGSKQWIGTFISKAETRVALEIRREEIFKEIGMLQGESMTIQDENPFLGR